MKHATFLLLLSVTAFLSCAEKTKSAGLISNNKTITDTIKYRKLKKLSITGDFDGDGIKDTVFEHNYSRLTKTEIDSAASPYEHDWQTTVVDWFYKQDPDLYISMHKGNTDTLHLGAAQGLYCLINIGDNNADRKDEIALVIDKLDYSQVNSCKIYTLCRNKWTLVKEFDIYEEAFSFTGEKSPVFNEIAEYLEKRNGHWFYIDYHQEYESAEDVGRMIRLKIEKCR